MPKLPDLISFVMTQYHTVKEVSIEPVARTEDWRMVFIGKQDNEILRVYFSGDSMAAIINDLNQQYYRQAPTKKEEKDAGSDVACGCPVCHGSRSCCGRSA